MTTSMHFHVLFTVQSVYINEICLYDACDTRSSFVVFPYEMCFLYEHFDRVTFVPHNHKTGPGAPLGRQFARD